MSIKPKEFEYEESRWQDIYIFLKNKGIDVYSPGMKVGECLSPYVIVKNDGSSKHSSFSSNVDMYAIMCYVPQKNYSKLEPFVQQIKGIMKELEPMILPYGMQTPSFLDSDLKAHMVSISYKNYKKI